MDGLINRLTPDQALEVLKRLMQKRGDIQDIATQEIESLLDTADVDEMVEVEDVAEDLFSMLECIEVEDLWGRSGGNSRGEYNSPEDMATEMVEEELEPYADQCEDYHKRDMLVSEKTYCMGVILGLYRFAEESETQFKEWSEDVPLYCGGDLLDKWRARCKDPLALKEMDGFLEQSCPKWAKDFARKND